jgi:hypothetical protein
MVELTYRLGRGVFAGFVVLTWVSTAEAQYQRPPEPSIGENYHVEASGVLWSAAPGLDISSDGLGQAGTVIDLVEDLNVEKKMVREVRVVLRPAPKHKFRFNYMPIKYEAEASVPREFVFNGQRYRIGVPVNTTAKLTTYRLGYEYDFFYRDRGYAGVMFDLKYTDIDVTLETPVTSEFMKAPAPIPAIGFTGRGYLAHNTSITGELSFFKVPENLGRDEFGGRYIDFDIYSTFNFNNNVGAQFGYRSVDVDYFTQFDTGRLNFRGPYFTGVVRF